jgi:predicted Zn-dependent peptidase
MSRILLEFSDVQEKYDLEVKRLSDALSQLLSSNSDGERARIGEKALDCIFDTDEHLFNFERVMTDLISLEMTKNRVQAVTSNFISRIRSQRESLSELQKNIKNYLKVGDDSDLLETAKRDLQESSEIFKKKVLETKRESESLTAMLRDKYEKIRLGKSNFI